MVAKTIILLLFITEGFSALQNGWSLQQENVCFGARNNTFGSFMMKNRGYFNAVKLVHTSGYVGCNTGSRSNWGCGSSAISVAITDSGNSRIFPRTFNYAGWFNMNGYTSNSKELVFEDPVSNRTVVVGEEMRLWYGEDLVKHHEQNNRGRSCADIYAKVIPDRASAPDHRVFDVECTRRSLTATWETRVFLSKAPLNISFLDPHCNVFHQNETHTWITTNFTNCGTVIHQRGDFIIQENVATATVTYQNSFIMRKRSYVYNISCVFDRKLNVMTANSFLASDRVLVGNGTDTSEFFAYIEMFESSSYLQVLTQDPVPVITFEPMYFGIKTDNKNPGLKFVVDQCYAVPTTGAQDVKYVFYDRKCPLDKTFKVNDYSNKHFNFEIEAFNFIRVRKSIRVHCKLLVCESNSTLQECQQECAASRKRRDTEEVSTIRTRRDISMSTVESIDAETTCDITYKKKKTCKDVTCPSNSTCLQLYPAVCQCNEGFVKETTSGKCRKHQDLIVRGIHIDMTYLPSYDDTKSFDYLRLVTRLEDELLQTLDLDDTIEGLKVIKVRKGSVIADITLIYSKKVSKEEVFNSFLNSTMTYARNTAITSSSTNTLRIKPDMVPTVDIQKISDARENDEEEVVVNQLKEVSALMIGVVVAVVVLIVAVVVVVTLLFRKHHRQASVKEVEISPGVDNYGVDLAEVTDKKNNGE